MKKIYHILSLCLVFPMLFSSCKDDFGGIDYPDSPLALSTDKEEVILDVATPESDAITFQWTPGTNFGSNAAIKYTFELALKGTNFSDAVSSSSQGQGNLTVTYKTAALNKLLLDTLGIEPGNAVELEARVTADVQAEGIEPQVSEVITISVQPYKPLSTNLFLIGSATPNGWSADDPTAMNAVQGTPGSFVWTGNLAAGEFKFITTKGEFVPSYNRGDDDNSLYFRESLDDPYDEPFRITEAGTYQVKVNLIAMTIEITKAEGPAYNELWFVGGFTGWSFMPMTQDGNDPFIFYYNAELNSDSGTDDFKIATVADFDPSVVFLRPETNAQGAGTDLPVVSWSQNENSEDYKWRVKDGVYKIKLDLRENTIDIVPFTPFANMYLLGEAAPNGWSIDNATAMTKSTPYQFTWTGALKTGEVKFTCDKQSDWNGAWFLASADGIEPTGEEEQMLFSSPGANPDNKWKITSAGTYTITLDQLKQTVIIKKQ